MISGMVAGDPGQGGATWAVLQYAIGLRELGHDVMLVEPVDELRPASIDYADSALAGSWALLDESSRRTRGTTYADIAAFADRAHLLLNISGMLTEERLLSAFPTRVYLDLDPAFNQLWQAVEGIDMRFERHSHFVTVGTRIGRDDCTIPACGNDWIPTLPPVVLSHWPVAEHVERDAFTTVGNLRGYGSITHDGQFYGQKVHSLRHLLSLPTRTDQRVLLAMTIHAQESSDLQALDAHGWHFVDPVEVAGTPEQYRRFVQGSKAELGVAKSGYVVSKSGWFSDRSACYLASGRPVLAQDTGFGDVLPTGEGLLVFTDVESAVEGIDAIIGDYEQHRRAARRLAEEHLDSRKVLTRLLECVGAG